MKPNTGDTESFIRLLKQLQIADNKLKASYKKGILLTGPSKVGKTTFLYHLLGSPLVQKEFQGGQVYQPEKLIEQALILHKPVSTTRLPNIIKYNNSDVYIVDLPGFEDTEPQARISNSFYILKALKCFLTTSFVFVIDSDSAYMRVLPTDFEESLNNFGGMFSERQIDNIKGHISLCISKAQPEDTIDSLMQCMPSFPTQNLNPNAQRLLSSLISSRRITFFYKPSSSSLQTPGNKMFEYYNSPDHLWQVKDTEINYHVLMEEGADTHYGKSAREFLERDVNEQKAMFQVFMKGIREVTEKRNQRKKDYGFMKEVQRVVQEQSKVYTMMPGGNGRVQDGYFSEYQMIRVYHEAVKALEDTRDIKLLEENISTVLKAIQLYAKLNEQELVLWKKFMYIFARKRLEINFLKFLLKIDHTLTIRVERDTFKAEFREDFQSYCETMNVQKNEKDPKYFETAARLMEPIQLIRGGDENGKRGDKIIEKLITCYRRLGDLKKNLHESTINYCKALVQKRKLLPPKDSRQQHLCEQSQLCSLIGYKLFQSQMYNLAIDFFKVSNNFTMICKCNLSLSSTDSTTLIELGDYCASILQLERAAEMYQRAFEESSNKKIKVQAWKKILKLRTQPQQYIEEFQKKINQENIVGMYEKPEVAVNKVDVAFQMFEKKKESAKISIQSIEEELNVIEKQLRVQLM